MWTDAKYIKGVAFLCACSHICYVLFQQQPRAWIAGYVTATRYVIKLYKLSNVTSPEIARVSACQAGWHLRHKMHSFFPSEHVTKGRGDKRKRAIR